MSSVNADTQPDIAELERFLVNKTTLSNVEIPLVVFVYRELLARNITIFCSKLMTPDERVAFLAEQVATLYLAYIDATTDCGVKPSVPASVAYSIMWQRRSREFLWPVDHEHDDSIYYVISDKDPLVSENWIGDYPCHIAVSTIMYAAGYGLSKPMAMLPDGVPSWSTPHVNEYYSSSIEGTVNSPTIEHFLESGHDKTANIGDALFNVGLVDRSNRMHSVAISTHGCRLTAREYLHAAETVRAKQKQYEAAIAASVKNRKPVDDRWFEIKMSRICERVAQTYDYLTVNGYSGRARPGISYLISVLSDKQVRCRLDSLICPLVELITYRAMILGIVNKLKRQQEVLPLEMFIRNPATIAGSKCSFKFPAADHTFKAANL